MIASAQAILLAWLRLLALNGDLAKAEPKTLRYRALHAAARLVRGGRPRRLVTLIGRAPSGFPITVGSSARAAMGVAGKRARTHLRPRCPCSR